MDTSNDSICRYERRHRSLPVEVQIENLPELRRVYRAAKRKSRRNIRGNEALTYIISAFYAKLLVILGIALPVTDAIATKGFESYNVFYLYLYSGSVLFLIYMYAVHLKKKHLQDRWAKSIYRQSTESNDSVRQNARKNSYIRYGSFYFRMGVTGFGIGSVIYSGLQLGQYWEQSSAAECNNVMTAVKPTLRIIFALMQMLFIFSYSNFLDVQKSKLIAKFGLMHMIATNLCEWFFVLLQETQHDIYNTAERRQIQAANDNQTLSEMDFQFINSIAFQITKAFYDHKHRCLKSDIMLPILANVEPYLAPCTVEYSFLCAVILAVMWINNCANNSGNARDSAKDLSPEISRQSGCNMIYGRSQSQFSVDCGQAHKGLFSGIFVLAVTIISLIMFFELLVHRDYKEAAILQVNIWEAILFWTATVAAIFCITSLRDVSFRRYTTDLELEHMILLVTQSGVFMYFLFQIIGGILMGTHKGKGGMMRIVTPFSALVQSSCQTVLILDAWRRRCSTDRHIRKKPGRQLVTFLLLTNISLWVVNRLKNNRSVSHPNQMDFYGVLAWNIITHVSMPLVVSYRFQSTVCFYEIWKHVYKTRPTKL